MLLLIGTPLVISAAVASIISAIIAAVAAGGATVGSVVSAKKNTQRQIDYDSSKTDKAQEFTREMNEYNSPLSQMQRYTDAGLNPFMTELTGGLQQSPAQVFQSADYGENTRATSDGLSGVVSALTGGSQSVVEGMKADSASALAWSELDEKIEQRVQNMSLEERRLFHTMLKDQNEYSLKKKEIELKEKLQNHTITKEEYELELQSARDFYDNSERMYRIMILGKEYENYGTLYVEPAKAGTAKTQEETKVIKSTEERAKESYEFERDVLRPAAKVLAWSQSQTSRVEGLYQMALMSIYSAGDDSDGNPVSSEFLNNLVKDAVELDKLYKENQIDKEQYIKRRRKIYEDSYSPFSAGGLRSLDNLIKDTLIGNPYDDNGSLAVSTAEAALQIFLKGKCGFKK